MNRQKLVVLGVCALAAIVVVLWIGDAYNDEARSFLRTLLRAL